MATFIERLQYFMENNGLNDNKLTVAAGLSVGLIGKAKIGNKGLTSGNIEKILLAYPQLNADWLLTGRGNMIATDEQSDTHKAKATRAEDGKGIPLIPVSAIAGFPTDGWSEQCLDGFERYRIPEFENKGADFLIRVSGDSMTPLYYSGDLLACHKIADIRFFQWGSIYVLETSQGVIVKRVLPADENDDCILCFSENSSVHKPFLLPKDDIRSLSTIIGLVRLV